MCSINGMESQANHSEEEHKNFENNFGKFTTGMIIMGKISDIVKDQIVPFLKNPDSFIVKEEIGGIPKEEAIEAICKWTKSHLEAYL